jgi:prepilin-type N-terminal cleavage/methylation domain-containing protein
MHNTHTKRGLTLVEMMVTTVLSAVLISSLLTFVSWAGKLWKISYQRTSLDHYSTVFFETMEMDLAKAKNFQNYTETPAGSGNWELKYDLEIVHSSNPYVLEMNINFASPTRTIERKVAAVKNPDSSIVSTALAEQIKKRYEFLLAHNVENLFAKMVGNILKFRLELKSQHDEEKILEKVYCRSILIPMK